MIKVCHITSVHKRYDGRIFQKECISLTKAGFEVYLLVNDMLDNEEVSGVHIISSHYCCKNRLDRMINSTRILQSIAIELDAVVYHIHDPELLPLAKKLKKNGKRVIFDSHEFYSKQMQNKPYLPKIVSRIVAKVYSAYEKNVLKTIDGIIIAATLDGINPFDGICKNVTIIGNFPIIDNCLLSNIKGNCKYKQSLCYVGELREDRGITNDILAAYSIGATLYLAGEFDENYKQEISKMVEYKCVEYLGYLDKIKVMELISKCMIGLYVESDVGQNLCIDTLGTKAYEYMSQGLPVILSDCKYHRLAVDQYKFGICVKADSVEELKQSIKYLFDNPQKATEMGANGKKAVEQYFNWSVEEKKLIRFYNSICQ